MVVMCMFDGSTAAGGQPAGVDEAPPNLRIPPEGARIPVSAVALVCLVKSPCG
jgi:hypothetical protein